MWLAKTRDARSFPTYFSHHDDENTKGRYFWYRCFIEEDEDSEVAASLFDKAGHDRQKFQGWPLTHDSVDFSEAMGGVIAGGTFLRIIVFESPVLTIYVGAASERTFSMGNDIGKVVSVILSQWLNVSWTT